MEKKVNIINKVVKQIKACQMPDQFNDETNMGMLYMLYYVYRDDKGIWDEKGD